MNITFLGFKSLNNPYHTSIILNKFRACVGSKYAASTLEVSTRTLTRVLSPSYAMSAKESTHYLYLICENFSHIRKDAFNMNIQEGKKAFLKHEKAVYFTEWFQEYYYNNKSLNLT